MTAGPDTSAPPGVLPDRLSAYRPPPGVADELLQSDGSIRPVWTQFLNHLSGLSESELGQRFARGDQYLHDAGVYYRQFTEAGSAERDWPLSHIPVIISGKEWKQLSDGIVQRCELLERVMADLYGPANIIRNGDLPPELVTRNPEWLRPIVGISPRSGHFLHFLAFEVGRSPDGSWLVLGDRTQAPSGAGFALENRMATSRVFFDHFPQANVERLASFYRQFRDALNGLRASGKGSVGILTPGPRTDTYFEHAYIARYLGFMLLAAEDLKIDDGRLAVRTIDGPEPVSVLWRRLDSRYADPLELDENSALGTPGMVSALRAGALTMLNCLGSGVLEARALMAFLPQLSRVLLGEPLSLPNIATWWCGQAAERDYVRQNLKSMMIGPALATDLPFSQQGTTVPGADFRDTAAEPVSDWLAREGADLVGQESVRLSTTPAMVDGRLQPRPMLVRVFAARTPSGWTVMPGGYARIGRLEDSTALAMQAGGSVADVWVVGEEPVATDSLTPAADAPFLRRMPGLLPSRAADNLFWLGRYVERAECHVRLLRAYHLRLEDAGDRELPFIAFLEDHLEGYGIDPSQPVPDALVSLFASSLDCAGKIRDRFSTDGWHALTDLDETVRGLAGSVRPGHEAAGVMSVILRKLAGFTGLVHENMYRFNGWRFLTMGRALERAEFLAATLIVFADQAGPPGGFDLAIEVADNLMSHRRRYPVDVNRASVTDLLVLDNGNPRSIIYQLEILHDEEARLPGKEPGAPRTAFSRQVLTLRTELEVAEPQDLSTDRLIDIRSRISDLSDALTSRYLV